MGNKDTNGHERGQLGADSQPSINLVGSHTHTLDAKRRVAIPKAFRAQIAALTAEGTDDSFVLCRQPGGDPCLALYPPGRFEVALERLDRELKQHAVGVGNKTVRAYLRKLRMSAARLVPDRQSRISLNEDQCRLADISREVVFVGNGDHMELWAPENLEGDDDVDFRNLANQIFG